MIPLPFVTSHRAEWKDFVFEPRLYLVKFDSEETAPTFPEGLVFSLFHVIHWLSSRDQKSIYYLKKCYFALLHF